MKIVILNFASGAVYVFPFEGGEAQDFFDTPIAEEYCLRENDCQYMVTEEEVEYINF